MADALSYVPGAQLQAVASRNLETAQTFAVQWDARKAYGAYAALYDDPDIDIVYIATPNALHKQNILDALNAGKHVLCEKPLTLSAEDSRACQAAAQARGLFLMEAMWTAFFPAMDKLRMLLAEGAIGTPHHLTANFISYRDAATFPNLFDPSLGGGASLDLGIYPVAAALLLAGPIASASAEVVVGSTGVDEMVAMSARHSSGIVSQLGFGFRLEMPVALRLSGSKGVLEISEDFHHPGRVTLRTAEREETFNMPPLGFGYAHEAIAVQDSIEKGLLECETWPLSYSIACAEQIENVRKQALSITPPSRGLF